METVTLEEKKAHHGGDVCVMCDVCFASIKSSEREFFVPAGMHLAVKLLIVSITYT
jgi:succinate dehydrogenase/fumarate reductase-like Fe-S protein